MKTQNKVKLGLPKGSLEERTIGLFNIAGFDLKVDERSYYPRIDDPEIECILIRAQEVPRYVESGVIDAGITGQDLILESRAKVIKVAELGYTKGKVGKVRLVLAVPENSNIKSVKDLRGKTIATEFIEITKDYLRRRKVQARVEFSWGATEIKPPRLADAIVELTDTGATIRAHNLKIIDTLMESSTQFIANQKSWQNKWKREKLKNLLTLLKGALAAEEMVGVFMHVPQKNFRKVLKTLPAMAKPTITKISGTNLYDFFVVSKKGDIRELVPKLKEAGCAGIIEFPLNKVIP